MISPKLISQQINAPKWRQRITRLLRFALNLVPGIASLAGSIWLSLALWVQLAAHPVIVLVCVTLWWILTAVFFAVWYQVKCQPDIRKRYLALLGYSLVFLLALGWWQTIQPQQHRQWAPDVARLLRVEQHGNLVTLHNVRNFDWRSATDFSPRWETRHYDLDKISSIDVITSYWMGPAIAHVLVSFGFEDGQYLTFSIETRRESHEKFSTIGGFFRKYELSLIAADEHDILYTRTNIRHEQVYLYRVNASKSSIRRLFEAYLDEARALEQKPRFYNTLTSNCTTLVFHMAKLINPDLPYDYRIVLTGYLPQYIYEQKGLDQRLDFAQLQQRAYINPYTQQYLPATASSTATYSAHIRQGLASANTP